MFSRLPFRALRIAFPAVLFLVAGLLTTCTDGNRPTDLSLEPMAMLAVNPVFNPALAVEGSADINRIRITAYLVGTDSILGQAVVDVDPTASEWTLDVSVVIPSGPNPQVVMTVELVNVTNGQETVQWSGQTAPITVTAGTTPTVESVRVVRGSLGNLTVTSVSIQEPIVELLEGESTQVTAAATSSDPNFQPEIFWASLDPGVASISSTGVLTALGPGSVRVVATAGAVADTASTNVRARATGVRIDPDGAVLKSFGEEVLFQGSVVDVRGNTLPGEAVTWDLESGAVLEDLGGGRYRALSRGSTVVTATSVDHPTLTTPVLVRVEQAVSSVEVTPETRTLQAVGQTAQFAARANDANGNAIEGMSFVWASSDDQIATVEQTGKATATGIGTATIFAEATATVLATSPEGAPVPGTRGSATLVVEQAVTQVEVTPTTHTFKALNELRQFTARALDGNGNVVSGLAFTWSTGNATIVTVDAAGSARAVAPGTTTVTATTLGFSGSANVSVQPEASSVTVTPETHTFSALGQTRQLQAAAKDANGNPVPNAVFVWTTSDSRIANVDNTGMVTAHAVGASTITASSSGKTGSAMVTVAPIPVALSWLVQPSNALVGVPMTPAPKVQALDGNGFLVSAFTGLVTLTELGQYTIEGGPEGAFSIFQAPPIQGPPVSFGSQIQLVVLGGSPAVAAVDGVATFSNLVFQSGGSYSLKAESPGLTSAESNVIGVTSTLADLSLTETVDNAVPAEGDTVTLVLTVKNLGPLTATGVKIQGTASTGLDFVSQTKSQGTVDLQTEVWDVGTLALGETASLQTKVLIENGTAGTTLTAQAYVSAVDQTDPVGSNNSAAVSINPVGLDISLSKTVDKSYPSEGAKIVYTVAAQNLGPANATNVVIRDTIPTGLILDSIQATGGSWNGGMEEWTVPNLTSGAADTIRFFVTVGSGTMGQFRQNEAQRTSTDQTDQTPSNDVGLAGITVQPLPAPISYNTAGNTELIAGAFAPPSTPHVTDVRKLTGTTPTLVVTSVGTFATANGGSVTIEADGDFSYTPKPGDQAEDQFDFTVQTGLSATVTVTKEDMVWYVNNASPKLPGTGVSNDPFETLQDAAAAQAAAAPPAPAGSPGASGPSLASPPPKTVFFLHAGNSQTTGSEYNGNFGLDPNQRLQGEGTGLSLESFPDLVPAGPRPQKINTGGDGLGMGSGSTVSGIDIRNTTGSCLYIGEANGVWVDQVNISECLATGVELVGTTGILNLNQVTITDAANAAIIVDGGNPVVNFTGSLVQNAGFGHLHFLTVQNTTGGSVSLGGGPFTDASSGTGAVTISGVLGPVNITQPMTLNAAGGPSILVQNAQAAVSFTNVDIDNPGHPGVQLSGNTSAVSFNYLDINNTGDYGLKATAHPGALNIAGGVINTTDGAGIYLQNTPTTATFTSVTVNNMTGGAGEGVYLQTTGAGNVIDIGLLNVQANVGTGAVFLSGAGTVKVTDPTSSLTATGVTALSAANTTLDLKFADVTSTTPGFYGINLYQSSGTFKATGGSITTSASTNGAGLHVQEGTVTVEYGGTITNTKADAWSVWVRGQTTGITTLKGLITDSGRGVQVGGLVAADNNTGGSVIFSGGLNLTGAGMGGKAPFLVTGTSTNGTIEVTGTGNKIAPASPSLDGTPGLEITNTAIGPGGVTFESVSSKGGAQGILLQNTGAGAFNLTGLGTTVESGGIIENTTGNGITLISGQDVSLSNLRISYPAGHGIAANGVKNFALIGSRVERTGNSETDVNGLDFNGLGGVAVVKTTVIERTGADCVAITNSAGTLDLNLDGSTLDQCGHSDFYPGHGINLFASFSAVVNINVINGSTISDATRDGIYAVTGGTAVVKVNADATGGQNNFSNNSKYGIRGNTSSSGSFDLKVVAGGVNQNVFTGNTWPIYSYNTGDATVSFDIDGNTFANGMIAGQFLTDDLATSAATLDGWFRNNTATGFAGAQILRFELNGDARGAVKVDGNDLTSSASSGAGITANAGAVGGAGSARFDLTLTNNEIDLAGSTGESIRVQSDLQTLLCGNVDGNFQGSPPTGDGDFDLNVGRTDESRFWLEDQSGTLGSQPSDSDVMTDLSDRNGGGISVWASSGSNQFEGVYPGTCLLPSTAAPSGTADIEVRKTVNPMYGAVSDPFTYTVVVKNRGPGTATGVVVGDSVRPVQSPTWSVSQGTLSAGNPGDTIWNVGTLAPGDSAIMTASGLLDWVTKTNFAWLISLNESDPNAANDSAQVIFDEPSQAPAPAPAADSPEPAPDRELFPEFDPFPDQPPKQESPQDESPWIPDQKPWPREGSEQGGKG